MKRMIYFLAAFVCLPLCLLAQDDSKYLAGAVPVVNGKVVFTKTISVPGLSQDEIFKRIQQWTGERFVTDKEQKAEYYIRIRQKGTSPAGEKNTSLSTKQPSLWTERSLPIR